MVQCFVLIIDNKNEKTNKKIKMETGISKYGDSHGCWTVSYCSNIRNMYADNIYQLKIIYTHFKKE